MAIYKTCRFIEHGIYFKETVNGDLTVRCCCNMDSYEEAELPHLIEKWDGGKIDWNEVLAKKRIERDNFRKGIYYPQCENCWELKEQETDEDDYFSHITIANICKCNSRCVYCYIGNHKELYDKKQKFFVWPIIKELYDKSLIRFIGSLRFMGGEPTLIRDFDKIVNFFVKNRTCEMYIPTSGIKTVGSIVNATKNVPFCEVYVSIDSSSRETYKKIKRIDKYNRVLNSLKKYVNARKLYDKNHIVSKYIVVIGINDNTQEIENWIKESVKIGIKRVELDIEQSYALDKNKEKFYKYLYKILKYTKNKVVENNLVFKCSCPYLHSLLKWAEDNKENLNNDISSEEIKFDLSENNIQDIKAKLNEIINKNEWKNPIINITGQKEVTEYKDFDEILYECRKLGFYVKLNTSGQKLSKGIIETIKLSSIDLTVGENGKYYKYYNDLLKEYI